MVFGIIYKYLLKRFAECAVKRLEIIDKKVRKHHFENEQWFLNFQDKVNEISVR